MGLWIKNSCSEDISSEQQAASSQRSLTAELFKKILTVFIGEVKYSLSLVSGKRNFHTDGSFRHMAKKFNKRQFSDTWNKSAFSSFFYDTFKALRGAGCGFDFKSSSPLSLDKLLVNRTVYYCVAQMDFAQIFLRNLVKIKMAAAGSVEMQRIDCNSSVGSISHLDKLVGLFKRADGSPNHKFNVNIESSRCGIVGHILQNFSELFLVRSVAAEGEVFDT